MTYSILSLLLLSYVIIYSLQKLQCLLLPLNAQIYQIEIIKLKTNPMSKKKVPKSKKFIGNAEVDEVIAH